jgi:hypothetical protein
LKKWVVINRLPSGGIKLETPLANRLAIKFVTDRPILLSRATSMSTNGLSGPSIQIVPPTNTTELAQPFMLVIPEMSLY